MEKPILLSSSAGEIVAPQTMATALIVSPDGSVTLDPGVLHGRSALETRLRMAARRDEVPSPQTYRIVWVTVELDASNQPVRFKGVSVGELLADAAQQVGFKSVAQQVNRMSEAIRGEVKVDTLTPQVRQSVKQQLMAMGQGIWDRSPDSLKQALEAA